MRHADRTPDPAARDHHILRRMLSDAEDLCHTDDPLLVGQYCHLRGRIAALIELMAPIGADEQQP